MWTTLDISGDVDFGAPSASMIFNPVSTTRYCDSEQGRNPVTPQFITVEREIGYVR